MPPNGWWWAGSTGAGISYGNVFQYEYTQPWTVIAAVLLLTNVGGGSTGVTGIIFSNVPDASPYPGYELWIDGNGAAHVRLINAFSTMYIGKYGSTNLADGRWHVVAATYDGSGLAAGVNIYVDGVLETMTVESDTLGGNSIKSTILGHSNFYFIGNRSPSTDSGTGEIGTEALPGAIGLFRQFNTVKSQATSSNTRLTS